MTAEDRGHTWRVPYFQRLHNVKEFVADQLKE